MQKRRRRTGREGALLAVTVFEPERIAAAAGSAALNEVWMALAARIQSAEADIRRRGG